MKALKRITALAVLMAILVCLAACAPESNDETYTIDGLTFTIPKNMKRYSNDRYDIYFSTLATAFMAFKIDKDFLEKEEIPEQTDAKAYVDFFFELNGLDREQCKVEYVERQRAYKFSFSDSADDSKYLFNYCMVLDGSECAWFVNISCNHESASGYLPTFEIWGNSIKAQ